MSLEIKKARRRSFDVRHVVITEDNMQEVAAWCNGAAGVDEGEDGKPGTEFVRVADKNAISTKQRTAYVGDHIVEMVTGTGGFTYKAYPAKNFEKAFEDIEEIEVARSAKSGEFVSHEEAAANPDTTVVEKITVPVENLRTDG